MRIPGSVHTVLRTAAALLVLPAALTLTSALALALSLLGASAARVHRVYLAYARLCVRVGGTEIEVYGAERVEPGRAYVVVSNHQSAWDPVCLVAALPRLVQRFVVKRAIMRIPIFGHALRATGNVEVVRHATAADVQRIREGMNHLEPNVSLLFFAEGTRSRDGALQRFKKGAFATALAYGIPVLPVAVAGTYAIWPKGTLRLRRGVVAIEVGEPVASDARSFEDRAALRDETYQAVVKLRARARQRLRARGQDPGGRD